jgi:hypothetical protein
VPTACRFVGIPPQSSSRRSIGKHLNEFDVNLGQIRVVCDENMVHVLIMIARVRDYAQILLEITAKKKPTALTTR